MEQPQLSRTISQIAKSGRITAEDVLRLRRHIYGGRLVTRAQVDALFELDRACAGKAPEWSDLFAEAIAVYLVEQQEPYGYVDEANADWLIERTTHNGQIDTATELEALIGVLEKAKRSPERLVRFALEAVKNTVLHGSGPTRRGGEYKPGLVTQADVNLLRRILYAYGGDQHIAVSRAEAEVLFDINDATAEAENHPSWSDLFVKAVANSVLFYSGYTVPTRQEALRREQWLDEPASLGSFFSRMVDGLGSVFSGYGGPSPQAAGRSTSRGEAEVNEARRVTEDEARWLAARFSRDHKLHENERALLAFLREKSVSIHPLLRPALDKVS